jgi:hypothetical protein
MPGYFHVLGVQQIVASAQDYGVVTFAVTVLPSTHQFDGFYDCVYFSNLGSSKFTIEIVDGRVISNEQYIFGGALNEADGAITGVFGIDVARSYFTGKLAVTSPLEASAAGTYYTTSITVPGNGVSDTGNWTCQRI